MPHNFDQIDGPIRRSPRGRPSFAQLLLFVLSIASALMLWLAVPNLVSGSATFVAIKSALLAIGGMTVSYGINRLAIERGAPLAVIGYASAGIASVVSILAVGFGLFAATYSGLVLRDVSDMALEAHGGALSDYVSRHGQVAAQAGRIVPVMNTIVSDLTAKLACEVKTSCVSGRPNGGRGPVTRILTEKLGQAKAIAEQIDHGGAARLAGLSYLSERLRSYRAVAQSTELGIKDKRSALQQIDSQIRQGVADLDEAMPSGLVRAYATALSKSEESADPTDTANRLTVILRGHGDSLSAVLGGAKPDKDEAPAFPPPAGVSDTIAYLGHFFPIAAIACVVELIFPIVLWLYTLLALSWSNYRIVVPTMRDPHPEDVAFKTLLIPAREPVASVARKRGRPRKNSTEQSETFDGRPA